MLTTILILTGLAVVSAFGAILSACALASQAGSTWLPDKFSNGETELRQARFQAFAINGGRVEMLPCGGRR